PEESSIAGTVFDQIPFVVRAAPAHTACHASELARMDGFASRGKHSCDAAHLREPLVKGHPADDRREIGAVAASESGLERVTYGSLGPSSEGYHNCPRSEHPGRPAVPEVSRLGFASPSHGRIFTPSLQLHT